MRINQKVIRENGEIFFFLINDEEVKNSRTTPAYFPLPTKA
jgi:hypothetical protein